MNSVIFDLDGTLVDSVIVCAKIFDEMIADRGGQERVPVELMRQYVSVGGARMVRGVLGEFVGDVDRDLEEFRARYARMDTPEESIFDGVRETLVALKENGLMLGVCSNKPQNLCEKVLGDLGMDGLFEVVIGGDLYPFSKPDPRHLLKTMELMGSHVDEALYVGDSEIDYELAERARVPFVWVRYGYGSMRRIPGDVPRIDKLASILEILFRH